MQAKTVWEVNDMIDEELVNQLALDMKKSKTFIRLCMNRGLHTKDDILSFIQPDIEWMGDPFAFYDMEKTVSKIQDAIAQHKQITVYGDYDADGITSTVILYETIEMLGGQVDYFIPNRFREGYGPDVKAFENLISNGTALIITVDNGVAGHEAIKRANELGAEVIVTDHHECPEELPAAYSIIHPRHPKQQYSCPDLSGAGVSLKLATALLTEVPEEFLELAAVGTIADVVSLTGENRAIAYFGLKAMRRTQRLGLLALLESGNINLETIDEETVGFQLAPPINAVGRLGDASLVVDLLTTFDEEKAAEMSRVVLEKNAERKALVTQITQEAFKKIGEQQSRSILVLSDTNWHEGVLGIVASKVAEKMNKPALILSIDESQGTAKGSGRSIEGFNLYECINEEREYLTSFGGHEMACGLTLPLHALDDFTVQVNQRAQALMKSLSSERQINVDGELNWEEVDIALIEEINLLKPFGQDNGKPLFKVGSVYPVNTKKIGADRTHLKSQLSKNDKQLDMIAFSSAHWADILKSSPEIDVIGYLGINEWNGFRKVQIQAVDYKSKDALLVDLRKSSIQKELFQANQGHFVFFKTSLASKWAQHINSQASYQVIESGETIQPLPEGTPVIVVDVPDDMEQFISLYQTYQSHPLYLYLHAPDEFYMKGMPKKEDFQKLYKLIMSKKELSLNKDTHQLTKYMKIDKDTIKFMLMVFLENEFVTIEDGKLSFVSNPAKKSLEDTLTYKQRLRQIEAEELLVYSSFKELLAYLRS